MNTDSVNLFKNGSWEGGFALPKLQTDLVARRKRKTAATIVLFFPESAFIRANPR
jgi:hypothetical protein